MKDLKTITDRKVLELQNENKIHFINGHKNVNPKIAKCHLSPSKGSHQYALVVTPNNNRNKTFIVGFLNID